tara:strand:+ start:822 stop:1337 length:516 start_codon:yes stop_codon:yes gene_type:complete
MGFFSKIKKPFKVVGSAIKDVVIDAPKAVAKDIYSGTKKVIGAVGRGTEEVFEGVGAIGAAGVNVVEDNPTLIAGIATGNPLLTSAGFFESTGGAFLTDPLTGRITPTPQTGQGGTVPFFPYTNQIAETPESTIINVPSGTQSNQGGFSLSPTLIFGGLGALLVVYFITRK